MTNAAIKSDASLVTASHTKVAMPDKAPKRRKIQAMLILIVVVRLCALGRNIRWRRVQEDVRRQNTDDDPSGGRAYSKQNNNSDTPLRNQTYPQMAPHSVIIPQLEDWHQKEKKLDLSRQQNQSYPSIATGMSNMTLHSEELQQKRLNLTQQQRGIGGKPGQNQTRVTRTIPRSNATAHSKETPSKKSHKQRTVPPSTKIPHIEELKRKKLHLSLKQQVSYFGMKDRVVQWLNDHANATKRRLLDFGGVSCTTCFAVILNDEYAYRHIYKTGGTTVERQAGRRQVPERECGNRLLLATARDPIDHFLSGWAECGIRGKIRAEDANATYDDRIFAWLNDVRDHQHSHHGERGKKMLRCENHSFPQANYLLLPKWRRREKSASRFYFHPKLDLVGDMRELRELLGMVGFEFNKTLGSAVPNQDKKEKYPWDRSLLSNRTVDALCDYLALDYYLFDYAPPSRCQDRIEADVASIMARKPSE